MIYIGLNLTGKKKKKRGLMMIVDIHLFSFYNFGQFQSRETENNWHYTVD